MKLKEGEIYQYQLNKHYYEIYETDSESSFVLVRDLHDGLLNYFSYRLVKRYFKPISKLKEILLKNQISDDAESR